MPPRRRRGGQGASAVEELRSGARCEPSLTAHPPAESRAADAPVDAGSDEPPADFTCAMCLELLLDPVTVAPCGHSFCASCMERWLARHKHHCPLCSTQMRHVALSYALKAAIGQMYAPLLAVRRARAQGEGGESECVAFSRAIGNPLINAIRQPDGDGGHWNFRGRVLANLEEILGFARMVPNARLLVIAWLFLFILFFVLIWIQISSIFQVALSGGEPGAPARVAQILRAPPDLSASTA